LEGWIKRANASCNQPEKGERSTAEHRHRASLHGGWWLAFERSGWFQKDGETGRREGVGSGLGG
jgi:hypothetical protein